MLSIYYILITILDTEDIIISPLLSISHSNKGDKYLAKKHSVENKNRTLLRYRFSPIKGVINFFYERIENLLGGGDI